MKAKIQRIEADTVMISELEHLITQLGAVGGVIVMVADELHLLAGFAKDGVIDNEGLVI